LSDGWLTVGDSAFALDPLSSQGIFHALASSILATEAIMETGKKPTSAIFDYSASLEQAWASFKVQRRDYYCLESRWPKEGFWKRRREMML
jgi:flavin-dependent dehydrogenase